jgi:hypothetical protein
VVVTQQLDRCSGVLVGRNHALSWATPDEAERCTLSFKRAQHRRSTKERFSAWRAQRGRGAAFDLRTQNMLYVGVLFLMNGESVQVTGTARGEPYARARRSDAVSARVDSSSGAVSPTFMHEGNRAGYLQLGTPRTGGDRPPNRSRNQRKLEASDGQTKSYEEALDTLFRAIRTHAAYFLPTARAGRGLTTRQRPA